MRSSEHFKRVGFYNQSREAADYYDLRAQLVFATDLEQSWVDVSARRMGLSGGHSPRRESARNLDESRSTQEQPMDVPVTSKVVRITGTEDLLSFLKVGQHMVAEIC